MESKLQLSGYHIWESRRSLRFKYLAFVLISKSFQARHFHPLRIIFRVIINGQEEFFL